MFVFAARYFVSIVRYLSSKHAVCVPVLKYNESSNPNGREDRICIVLLNHSCSNATRMLI